MDVFEALADPVRRALLAELATGPSRVIDLAARHPISRPAISRHLRLLSEAGLVTATDRGRERHYALDAAALDPVQDLLYRLADTVRTAGDEALDALDTEVRRDLARPPYLPAAPPRGNRMSVKPTGRIERDGDRHTLVITRKFRAPDRGRVGRGDRARAARALDRHLRPATRPRVGCQFTMTAEGEDAPAEPMDVRECDPPHRLALTSQVGGVLAPRAGPGGGGRRDDADLHPAGHRPGRRRERRPRLGVLPGPAGRRARPVAT